MCGVGESEIERAMVPRMTMRRAAPMRITSSYSSSSSSSMATSSLSWSPRWSQRRRRRHARDDLSWCRAESDTVGERENAEQLRSGGDEVVVDDRHGGGGGGAVAVENGGGFVAERAGAFSLSEQSVTQWLRFAALLSFVGGVMWVVWLDPRPGAPQLGTAYTAAFEWVSGG